MSLRSRITGEAFWQDMGRTPFRFAPGTGLYKIYSGFGGLAIYKKESLKNCRFTGYVTPDLEKVIYDILNTKIKPDHRHYRMYTSIINMKEEPLPVITQPNSGYDGPVVCEHCTLQATMILNGHDKIYVNPNMICIY